MLRIAKGAHALVQCGCSKCVERLETKQALASWNDSEIWQSMSGRRSTERLENSTITSKLLAMSLRKTVNKVAIQVV
jgi:hypothetical protein